VVNQSLVHRINIGGKIATKPENLVESLK